MNEFQKHEDAWAEAHNALTRALEKCVSAGMSEDEAHSAVDDTFNEDQTVYKGGGPKPVKS